MKKLFAIALLIAFLGSASGYAQTIEITRNASMPSILGGKEYFTGRVVVDPLYPATAQTGATTGLVTFAPGARTAWHTHPAGQLLIVQSGKGWVQQDGQARQVINPGDVIWIPANTRHWHGATANNGMSHIAVSYMKDGQNVIWKEQVTDKQYNPE